jgi:hypothetical protein
MLPIPIAFVAGTAIILLILWDAFETVILPRSVIRLLRLSRVINSLIWPPWSALASHLTPDSRRERYLGFYGPASVILMLVIWATGLVFGFGLVSYGLGSPWILPQGRPTFWSDVYVSGTTLFTLGLGDVMPASGLTRCLLVVEAGTGLGFLAAGIAYLPVLYQSFSRREAQITLLDAWAGSPPSAVELLHRLAAANAVAEVQGFLKDWERWCAEVLEGHISYTQVAYFRSQHGKQSWVAALTAVLDVSTLVLVGIKGVPTWQARLTFAIARHAAVDLSQVLNAPPRAGARMDGEQCAALVAALERAGIRFEDGRESSRRLEHLRRMYEPYVAGLSAALSMRLPAWVRDGVGQDNWESTPRRDRELTHL